MKRFNMIVLILVLASMFMLLATGCVRQDYYLFEDGEFDGIEFSDYDLMHNAEVEMDDIDRN